MLERTTLDAFEKAAVNKKAFSKFYLFFKSDPVIQQVMIY